MTRNLLPSETVHPPVPATATVIWMHGLGAFCQDFVSITHCYQALLSKGVRFIFPQAPVIPITVNQGLEMPGWFDIIDLSFTTEEDQAGIIRSIGQIQDYILHETAQGIASSRIVLAGFSQGAAIALATGLTHENPLAGIVALSGYLPIAKYLNTQLSAQNKKIPIYLSHGLFDPVISLSIAEASKSQLCDWGYTPKWQTYPIAHTVVSEQIEAIGDFLHQILP